MNKKSDFTVRVYVTKKEWDELRPTYEFDEFEDKAEAISEAELWPDAYQAVVVTGVEDNKQDTGEFIFVHGSEKYIFVLKGISALQDLKKANQV